MDEMLTVQDAAAHLGVSVSLLNQYRMTGKGPTFYKLGNLVRYERSEIERWARSRIFRSTRDFTKHAQFGAKMAGAAR